MSAAFAVEWLKLRRSRVASVTTIVLLVVPCGLAAGFLSVAHGTGGGALTAKAGALLVGDGWTGYLSFLNEIFATGGLLGMGIVVAWCFGREFAERTVVSLYACAISRDQVAAAKFAVLSVWSAAICLLLPPVALLTGLITGLGAPGAGELAAIGRLLVLAFMTALLALTVGVPASAGRGYLPAFGAIVGLVVAAQVAVLVGAGAWFPYSAAGLWAASGPAGAAGVPAVPTWHLVVVPLTAIAALTATVGWWRRAELV